MPKQPDRNRGLSAAEFMQKRAAEEAARKEALQVVERWNAERSPLWSPTIRCAIVAGTPWLDVYCPGGEAVISGDNPEPDSAIRAARFL